MTTFTTTIVDMFTLPQVDGQTDVVVSANYLMTGVDGDHTASIEFSQQFTLKQDSFTPYSELTQDQVISWADPRTVSNMQDCVQDNIDKIINPPVFPSSQPLPWNF